MFFHSRYLKDERAATLPAFAVFLFALVAITAVSVEITKGVMVNDDLEVVSDAITIAGAGALNGEDTGWRNAKRRALIAIRNARIHGIADSDLMDVVSYNAGPITDSAEIAAFQRSQVIVNSGEVTATFNVRRGFYSPRNSDREARFFSLEGDNFMDFGLHGHLIANAVQVNVLVEGVTTPIASIFNFDGFQGIAGSSMAANAANKQAVAAPIAIPACALLNDMNNLRPDSPRYDTTAYRPFLQCSREIVAREVGVLEGVAGDDDLAIGDPLTLDAGDLRRIVYEGIKRAETYPLPPIFPPYALADGPTVCYSKAMDGNHANCKGYPISAFLGVPGNADEGPTTSTIEEITNVIAAAMTDDPILAITGGPFSPLAIGDGDVFPGVSGAALEAQVDDLTDTLRNYIRQGDLPDDDRNTIEDAFTVRLTPELLALAYPGVDNPPYLGFDANYPFRRTIDARPGSLDPLAFLRVTWADVSDSGADIDLALLMGQAPGPDPEDPRFEEIQEQFPVHPLPAEYTNPLCHDPGLRYDDHTESARQVKIMLIAPEPGDGSFSYCDLDSRFSEGEEGTEPPRSLTRPIIVGFVDAYVFDFNFRDIGDTEPGEPPLVIDRQDDGTSARPPLLDNNPMAYDIQFTDVTVQDFVDDVKLVSRDHFNVKACRTCLEHDMGYDEGTGEMSPECERFYEGGDPATFALPTDVPEDIDCPADEPDIPDMPAEPNFDDDGTILERPDWLEECFGEVADVIDLIAHIGDTVAEKTDVHNDIVDPADCVEENTCVVSCYRFCGGVPSAVVDTATCPVHGAGTERYCPYMDPSIVTGSDEDRDSYIECLDFVAAYPDLCEFYTCSNYNHPENNDFPVRLPGDGGLVHNNLMDKETMYASNSFEFEMSKVSENWMSVPNDSEEKCSGDCSISAFSEQPNATLQRGYGDNTTLGELIDVDYNPCTVSGECGPAIAFCPPANPGIDQCEEYLCDVIADADANAQCMEYCTGVTPDARPDGDPDVPEAVDASLDFMDEMSEMLAMDADDGDTAFDLIVSDPDELVSFMSSYGSRAGRNCIPIRRQDQFDLTRAESWWRPEHRVAGFGCAGIRLRLSCDPQSFVADPEDPNAMPILINEAEVID